MIDGKYILPLKTGVVKGFTSLRPLIPLIPLIPLEWVQLEST